MRKNEPMTVGSFGEFLICLLLDLIVDPARDFWKLLLRKVGQKNK